ncbi:MAG: arsenic resistance protein [Candidatus Adiutrix sp.]
MNIFETLQPLFILGALFVGLLIGQIEVLARNSAQAVAPALMCMLFGLFLGISLKELRQSFFDGKFTLSSLGVNFIWTPALGWVLGGIFLPDNPALRLGFIMLLVTPCTDWYLAFTKVAKGNINLSTSILPLNLLLQVLLLPFYLYLFAGLSGGVNVPLLAQSSLVVLFVPFALGQATRRFAPENSVFFKFLSTVFVKGQLFFLCFAIGAMFASQALQLAGHLDVFFKLLSPLILFFVINFVLVRFLATLMRLSFADSVSLNLTTLARNSPIALAIAVVAFPDQPQVALALVIGPLIELPVLAGVAQLLLLLTPKGPL